MENSGSDKRSVMAPRLVPVGENPTLCFIEDNDENLILYEWINARYLPDYTFQLYSDGFFLQERLNAIAPKPDLILLDLKMPHITGCELLTQLKEHPDWKHIPVVIFTHSTSPKDVEHCFAAGADGFINKEISVHGITAQLVEVCEHWLKYT
ncbi:response regulator [Larkinella punicea]|uniref:Response regulator n=1 Tax=Larkinella punicea TaxID=2315727 RepID=A0A368JGZ3_9BACT|nr:response regulator [Larkinella punicea]RCR66525.1 response regulator [Larkinella punicea]